MAYTKSDNSNTQQTISLKLFPKPMTTTPGFEGLLELKPFYQISLPTLAKEFWVSVNFLYEEVLSRSKLLTYTSLIKMVNHHFT